MPRSMPHTDLQQIDGKMFQLFALVVEALAAATDALLSGDRHVAAVLSGRDELVDNVYEDVGRLVNRAVALEARDPKDLRFLLAALRVVPELERSHELAEHIARRAAYGLGAELTPGPGGSSTAWARWAWSCGVKRPTPGTTRRARWPTSWPTGTRRWTSCKRCLSARWRPRGPFIGGYGARPGGPVLRTPGRPCRQRGPHGVSPARRTGGVDELVE